MNLVRCECGKHYPADSPLERVKIADMYSMGVRCPYCKRFEHSYFENDALCEMREAMNTLGRKRHQSKKNLRAHNAMQDNYLRCHTELQRQGASLQLQEVT